MTRMHWKIDCFTAQKSTGLFAMTEVSFHNEKRWRCGGTPKQIKMMSQNPNSQYPDSYDNFVDPLAETRPHARYVPQAEVPYQEILSPPKRRRNPWACGCLFLSLAIPFLVLLLAYLALPLRTNILVMGIDARADEADYGRTDTLILSTLVPYRFYAGALSIPRDLWVTIPGNGENRINTAHFFAELDQPGSGPQGAMEAVRLNFGVDVDYYARVRFEGFQYLVDALGGVEVDLPEPMSGYPAGRQLLNGEQALALVRDRSGSDDFFRMQRAQIFLKSVWRGLISVKGLGTLPAVIKTLPGVVDTDIPLWQWPRIGLALLVIGPDNIDARTITREMVNPFTTEGGANVLGPNWELVNPVLMEMFEQ
jgi:LCP family protein required for cell wall assembly